MTLGSEALGTAVINGLDIGVLLVDSALHLRLASKTGTEMLRAADGLAVERDRLACADRAAHRRLRQLVAMAADPDGPVGSVAVPRPSGARPYLLTVMPLHDERAWLGTPRACALVLAIDPARCRPASAAHLCERYRLTAAEARTALALLEAERLRDVAERLGVSLPTVRTTLQRVFNKTDTHRQPELVWLLLAQGAAEDDAAAPGRPVSPDRPRRPAVGPRCAPPLPGGAGRSTCAPTAVSRRRWASPSACWPPVRARAPSGPTLGMRRVRPAPAGSDRWRRTSWSRPAGSPACRCPTARRRCC